MKNAENSIHTSAPGSVMITGEHAVVYGHKSIVAAIEQRIHVYLSPRQDDKIFISSEIADDYVSNIADLEHNDSYRFVLAAIQIYKNHLTNGFHLSIHSDINPNLGLGSSAAVTIACLGALSTITNKPFTDIHQNALSIIQKIQGRGSGADLAASYMGGMISYENHPNIKFYPLPLPPQLSLRYVGYKTPTSEVLKIIADAMVGNENYYDDLYAKMGDVSRKTIQSSKEMDWEHFGEHLNTYQSLMEKLGVSDNTIDKIISSTRSNPKVLGTKISGSGLGDCVLALGDIPEGFTAIKLASKGLIVHD